MKAISIRSPWWWFILHGGKDIENRNWPTSYRGRVLVHASSWWSLRSVDEDSQSAIMCREQSGIKTTPAEITYRQMRDLGGYIVGAVDIVDCITRSDSPWFFGTYGFVLSNPEAFAVPIECRGALGLFNVPEIEGIGH